MAFDREIAALTVFCEASSASSAERRDIMHSIFNRLKDGRFGKTIADVCLARYQYSEWNDDRGDNANLRRGAVISDDNPIMIDCLAAYDEVKAGTSDLTNGSTHYHDKSISPPSWTARATKTLETDKFIFYSHVP